MDGGVASDTVQPDPIQPGTVQSTPEKVAPAPSAVDIAAYAWLAGLCALAAFYIVSNAAFLRKNAKMQSVYKSAAARKRA